MITDIEWKPDDVKVAYTLVQSLTHYDSKQ